MQELSSKFFAQSNISKPSLIEQTPIAPIPYTINFSSGYGCDNSMPPIKQPRQINFSLTDESNSIERKQMAAHLALTQQSNDLQSDDSQNNITALQQEIKILQEQLTNALKLESQVDSLKVALETINTEKNSLNTELKQKNDNTSNMQFDLVAKNKVLDDLMAEKKSIQLELNDAKAALNKLQSVQAELEEKKKEFKDLEKCFNNRGDEMERILLKIDDLTLQVDILNQQINSLNKTVAHKDELLSKHDKNALNYAQNENKYLENINRLEKETMTMKTSYDHKIADAEQEIHKLKKELDATQYDLYEKIVLYEKAQLDMKQPGGGCLTADIGEIQLLKAERERNAKLEKQLAILKDTLGAAQQASSPKEFQLDAIAEDVEKELNYSAQLDSNILKAIESDEINSDEDNFDRQNKFQRTNVDVMSELNAIRQKYEMERNNCVRLQQLLDSEKKNSGSLQEHDANIIEAMRQRLEAALEQENQLHKSLDNERMKSERLSTQILIYQRTISRDSGLLLKSPPDSPRRIQRSTSDFESEVVKRLQSEVKLLTAQNERERERVGDIERVMEREKHRIEKELADRRDYGDRMKGEMDRMLKEKELLVNDLEHTQER